MTSSRRLANEPWPVDALSPRFDTKTKHCGLAVGAWMAHSVARSVLPVTFTQQGPIVNLWSLAPLPAIGAPWLSEVNSS